MPGANCCIVDCFSSRRHKDLGIFKIPGPSQKDQSKEKWRKELLGIIKRGREVDKIFKEQIENGKVYICERHFKPEEIKICKFIYLAASICLL